MRFSHLFARLEAFFKPAHLSPGCRAVELSRLRRGAVEPVVEALPVEPVEPVEADSMCRCVELSRAVENCRAVEKLSRCRACREVSSCCRACRVNCRVNCRKLSSCRAVLGVILRLSLRGSQLDSFSLSHFLSFIASVTVFLSAAGSLKVRFLSG